MDNIKQYDLFGNEPVVTKNKLNSKEGCRIVSHGYGVDGCHLKVGDMAMILVPPVNEDEWAYPPKSVGKIGKVLSLQFDDRESFPDNPVIKLDMGDLELVLLYDQDGVEYCYEFYKEELSRINVKTKAIQEKAEVPSST